MSAFHRPLLDVTAPVVARRALTMGSKTYEPGEPLSADDRAQLTDRQLATMWQQGLIDTPPAPDDAELERLTAPPAKPKQQAAAARR